MLNQLKGYGAVRKTKDELDRSPYKKLRRISYELYDLEVYFEVYNQ